MMAAERDRIIIFGSGADVVHKNDKLRVELKGDHKCEEFAATAISNLT